MYSYTCHMQQHDHRQLATCIKGHQRARSSTRIQLKCLYCHVLKLFSQIIMEMWSVYFSVLVIILLVISTTHWIYRWKNPKYNGNLPPGSMGFPYIGETLQFLIPSKSLDIPNFMKNEKVSRKQPSLFIYFSH